MKPLTIKTIRKCPRCGDDHTSVEAMPLHRAFVPPEAGGIIWTHWAACPTNGDPILFMTNAIMRDTGNVAIPEGPGMPAVIPLSVSAEQYDAEVERLARIRAQAVADHGEPPPECVCPVPPCFCGAAEREIAKREQRTT